VAEHDLVDALHELSAHRIHAGTSFDAGHQQNRADGPSSQRNMSCIADCLSRHGRTFIKRSIPPILLDTRRKISRSSSFPAGQTFLSPRRNCSTRSRTSRMSIRSCGTSYLCVPAPRSWRVPVCSTENARQPTSTRGRGRSCRARMLTGCRLRAGSSTETSGRLAASRCVPNVTQCVICG
jgi:hypothetical protein